MFSNKPKNKEYIGEYVDGYYRGDPYNFEKWEFFMTEFTGDDISDRIEGKYKIKGNWMDKENIIFYSDYDPLNKENISRNIIRK